MSVRHQKGQKAEGKSQFTDVRAVLTKYIYHWPLFILGLLIAAAGAYFYMHIVNPVYEISATILVKDEKKSPEDKPAIPELEQSSSPKNAEAEIEILRSKNLIGKVVNDLQLWTVYTTKSGFKTEDLYETTPFKFVLVQKGGMMQGKQLKVTIKDKNTFEIENMSGHKQTVAFNTPLQNTFGTWKLTPTGYIDQYIGSTITINLNDPELVANNYIRSLDVHLLDKLAPTIGIFTADEVPQRGKDFLNNLIRAYNEASIAEEKRKDKATIDFIDARLASLTGELSHSEQQVEGYRSSQGIADIGSQTKAYLETQQTNEQKLNDVNVQLNVIDGIENYVNSNASGSAPATIGINDPTLTSQIEKLSTLQLKRTELLATTPESNPIFDPINKQIASTKAAIKETIIGIRNSLINSKRQLQAFNNKYESSIHEIPGQERQFGDMKRSQTVKENLYVYLLQKREELSLAYASTFADARIVDHANVGDIKWPRIQMVAAIAFLLGIGLPFLLIYSRESLGNKITSRRDIDSMNIPVLGELSYEDHGKNALVVTDKNFLISEQFRSLRTNLNFLHQNLTPRSTNIQLDLHKGMVIGNTVTEHQMEGKGRVTIFTSSVSKEGKSFVSANMAASLAVSGRRTVVLEMDLRKPKLSKTFGLSYDHPGISDYLSYNIPLQSIIQSAPQVPNLDVISSGPIPSDPSELLEKDRFIELIAELREKYDDVVIDTPPLHLVTDAMIISRAADLALYVVRQGYTGKDELEFLNEIYQSEKLPNLTIIFNGIKRNKYGYGYRYDNSYYAEKRPKRSFKSAMKQFLTRF